MKRAIILSHTVMWAPKFCTNVYVDGKQVRLRKEGNQPLIYGDILFRDEDIMRYWQPGGLVDLPDLLIPPHANQARPTHPEDTIVSPGDIKLYTDRCTDAEFARIINQCRADSLEELFPGVCSVYADWGKRHVRADIPRRLKRSVGYIACTSVELFEDDYKGNIKLRVRAYQGNDCIGNFPLNSVKQQAAFREGRIRPNVRYFNVTVRFALAEPWDKRGEDILKCYVMVSHIHGLPE